MNSIRQIQELNKRELENGVSPEASWHSDYRDTAYIYIGGLPFELSEGDIVTIFSQFGEPTYINLIRDKETGKSRGFAFLKYEDQRSTDLAVDNLGGAVIMGRTLKVDHTRYKKQDDEPGEDINLRNTKQIEADEGGERRKRRRTEESESEEERPMIQEEKELQNLIQEHDEDDPMKTFLIEEKKEEVAMALAKIKAGKEREKKNKHRHRHRSEREKGGRSEREREKHRQRRSGSLQRTSHRSHRERGSSREMREPRERREPREKRDSRERRRD
ncbi:hypothetical protein BGZ60DRAFT_535309 [Tricladium varicosporioides]|nr:hypothetical protein BGZ60DRAFT_535309 [Hymenoscyphus varicosporioides]